MSKLSLTEATMLALQGKLNLTEDVEIETSNTDVTVGDGVTIVEDEEATVVVTEKQDENVVAEPTNNEEVIEVPVEGDETIVINDVAEEPAEEPAEEFKKVKTEDLADDIEEILKEPAEEVEEIAVVTDDTIPEGEPAVAEEPAEVEEVIPEVTDKANDVAGEVTMETRLSAIEAQLGAIQSALDKLVNTCDDCVEEPTAEVEETDNEFNEPEFESKICEYMNKKYPAITACKVENITKIDNGLKLECKLTNKRGMTKDIKLEMAQERAGKFFTKYKLKESTGLLKESKNYTITMITEKRDNVITCKSFK